MLSVDPARRISPELILSHPFITDQQLVNISGDNPKYDSSPSPLSDLCRRLFETRVFVLLSECSC